MTGKADGGHEARDDLKTITISEREIRAAAILLSVLAGEEVDRGRELTTLAKGDPRRLGIEQRSALAERARKEYVDRARRSRLFNSSMFGEGAWDMLLALYATELSGARHTVSGLISLAGVPTTTALRWLDFLDSREQLVDRRPDPNDGRVFLIELTEKARNLLDAHFLEAGDEAR